MLHGLPGAPSNIPTCLYPIPFTSYDPTPQPPVSAPTTPTPKNLNTEPSLRPSTGKSKKRKKGRGGGNKAFSSAAASPAQSGGGGGDDVTPAMDGLSLGGGGQADGGTVLLGAAGAGSMLMDTASLYPVWSKVSSSDSEFSDTEGGQANRIKSFHGKVRQCALACLHALFKVTMILWMNE